jgi:hypothetical protein
MYLQNSGRASLAGACKRSRTTAGISDMGIDLCGFQLTVPKNVLDRADIGDVSEQTGRERMPECMTGNPLVIDTSPRYGILLTYCRV